MIARFSTVGGESGSADTARDPRGFALKFYTEEGNWDLVGNNTPIFFIRDPILFPSFIHTQKRNPKTHLKDPNMFWDFISLREETTHQVDNQFCNCKSWWQKCVFKYLGLLPVFGPRSSWWLPTHERIWKSHFQTCQWQESGFLLQVPHEN